MCVILLCALVCAVLLIDRAPRSVIESPRDLTRIQLQQIRMALECYDLQCGRYPTSDEGLESLLTNTVTDGWRGRFLDCQVLPVDGWGRRFLYTFTNGEPEVRSAGSDVEFYTADDMTSK